MRCCIIPIAEHRPTRLPDGDNFPFFNCFNFLTQRADCLKPEYLAGKCDDRLECYLDSIGLEQIAS